MYELITTNVPLWSSKINYGEKHTQKWDNNIIMKVHQAWFISRNEVVEVCT